MNKLLSFTLFFQPVHLHDTVFNFGRDNFWVRNLLNHLPKISLKPGQWEQATTLNFSLGSTGDKNSTRLLVITCEI